MAQKGLGTGLGALFGADAFEDDSIDCALLPITKVEAREDQPRKVFDEAALAELAESIGEHGIIQPLTVRKLKNGYYQIIAGERRWRAARIAGLTQVPARIIEADDREAMELALIENLQREDLNPIEEAEGYNTLIEEYGLTQEEAANRVGRSRPAVANALRLLNLPENISGLVQGGKLSAGHARTLLGLKNKELLFSTAQTVMSHELSVRQTENLVKKLNAQKEAPPTTSGIIVDYVAEIETQLGKSLGRKVKLTDGKKRGKIEIEFYGADDREALIEALINIGKIK